MARKQIQTAIVEINRPGSELNKQYEKWRNGKMTSLVADILQYLSTPEQSIKTVPAVGNEPACTLIGYVSGRSHSAADMVALDELQINETATLEDDYAKGE